MPADARVIRQAASLLLHASRRDFAALTLGLGEIEGEAAVKDIILAMALLMEMDVPSLQGIEFAASLRETA